MGDDSGAQADLTAQITLQLGRVSANQQLTAGKLDRLLRRIPVDARATATAVATAAGTAVVDLGGPAVGRLWLLRRLVVWSGDLATTVSGASVICYAAGSGASLSLPDAFDRASGLPAVAFYSSRQVVIAPPGRVILALAGVAAGASVGATLAAEDWEAGAPVLDTAGS